MKIDTDDAESAVVHETRVRQQISFYASTPPYRPVFELHGWGQVAAQLSALAGRGKWQEMPRLITDEMLETFSLRGTWQELPRKVLAEYGGLLDRVSYYLPFVPGKGVLRGEPDRAREEFALVMPRRTVFHPFVGRPDGADDAAFDRMAGLWRSTFRLVDCIGGVFRHRPSGFLVTVIDRIRPHNWDWIAGHRDPPVALDGTPVFRVDPYVACRIRDPASPEP